mmetsp:Transcript_42849/g.124592  ORF Transcript_42849/g.124592 Transcript_42849/m.124592 type:complete len:277 (+) Transcript_42849:627-1457(+)
MVMKASELERTEDGATASEFPEAGDQHRPQSRPPLRTMHEPEGQVAPEEAGDDAADVSGGHPCALLSEGGGLDQADHTERPQVSQRMDRHVTPEARQDMQNGGIHEVVSRRRTADDLLAPPLDLAADALVVAVAEADGPPGGGTERGAGAVRGAGQRPREADRDAELLGHEDLVDAPKAAVDVAAAVRADHHAPAVNSKPSDPELNDGSEEHDAADQRHRELVRTWQRPLDEVELKPVVRHEHIPRPHPDAAPVADRDAAEVHGDQGEDGRRDGEQ